MDVERKQEGKQVEYRGWKAMPYVVGNETCEKLGTLGTSSNLLVYLTTVFNIKSVRAATTINIWNGTTNMATLVGAILSDTYFGRYATLGFSSISSFLGMAVLTLTAAVRTLHPPHCDHGAAVCVGPTPWQLTFLISGLGLLVIGAGGIRPCNLAFGADQFNPKTESGRRGINSFFNLYFVTFTCSMMIAATVIVYVQSNISWAVGLAIPAALMLFSCVFFFAGTPIYVIVGPQGSPVKGIAQVMVAAARKRHVELPKRSCSATSALFFNPPAPADALNAKLSLTHQFRFLEKAAIIDHSDELDQEGSSPKQPWRLCTLQQVEEVKCLIRLLPIWWAGTIFFLGLTQQSTFSVLQALQSDRRLHNTNFVIPAASFSVFSMLTVTLWLPFYDRIAVPWLRRRTKKEEGITLLQRIGTGLFISAISTMTAAFVEQKRRKNSASSPMPAFWLVPQIAISGLAEAFASIGQVEFYYKQFPENMRSIAGSFTFLAMAVANYLSGFLVTLVHRISGWLKDDLNLGSLDHFYLLIAGLEIVNFLYFLAMARWYKYRGSVSSKPEEISLSSLNA
ncbi:protein NRT1/ PTR FAMILY 2.11-like [Wolffia australiana]